MRACCAFLAPSEHRSEAAVVYAIRQIIQSSNGQNVIFILEYEQFYVMYERLNFLFSYVCLVVQFVKNLNNKKS